MPVDCRERVSPHRKCCYYIETDWALRGLDKLMIDFITNEKLYKILNKAVWEFDIISFFLYYN